eukprot:6466802-Amphidinium_carterae.1
MRYCPMKLQNPKLGQLKLVQFQVHFSLWLIMKDDNFTGKKGLKIEYEPGCKDMNVILLDQKRYTYELMDKFSDDFNDVKPRAVLGLSEGFKNMAEPVDAPLSVEPCRTGHQHNDLGP